GLIYRAGGNKDGVDVDSHALTRCNCTTPYSVAWNRDQQRRTVNRRSRLLVFVILVVIIALIGLGIAVAILTSDAEQRARRQTIDVIYLTNENVISTGSRFETARPWTPTLLPTTNIETRTPAS